MTRLPLILACLLLALGAVACGGDDEQEVAAPAATPTATPAPTDFSSVSDDLTAKPAIPAPSGEPPAELQQIDIVEGTGRAARAGDTVSVQYVGTSWSTGAQFDASWDRGSEAFTFPLGAQQVIAGWDQGVAGMKKGGRRVLVIPPDLAYGAQSPSPEIAPSETLVFVVDLTRIG